MQEAFKNLVLTPEEKQKVISYIESIMDKEFDEVDALAKTSWYHCKNVMKFFQISPKTELHQRFQEKFLEPIKKIKQKVLEWKLMGEMKNNKELFIHEHLIDSYEYNDVKYQIIRRYSYRDRDWTVDEVIQVSIPYFSSQAWRDKFWYSILISRSKTPEFFDELIKNMKVYKWNATLTSNKR